MKSFILITAILLSVISANVGKLGRDLGTLAFGNDKAPKEDFKLKDKLHERRKAFHLADAKYEVCFKAADGNTVAEKNSHCKKDL